MKTIIKKSLQSLLFVPALALGVSAVVPMVQSATVEAQSTSLQEIRKGADETGQGTDDGGKSVGEMLKTVTNTLLFIIGAVSVIMIIFGGFKYVTSGGDSAGVTSAKNTILYSVIGLVVAALAYVIIDFVIDNLAGE